MDNATAQQVSSDLQAVSRLCDDSLRTVAVHDGLGVANALLPLVGNFMGYSYTNILRPLWREFPDLEPSQMREAADTSPPILSAESRDALNHFLVKAREALVRVRNSVQSTGGGASFEFGGVAEVEQAVAAIEQFLYRPHRASPPNESSGGA